MENLIKKNKLEQVLLTNWSEYVDQTQFLRFVLTHSQQNNYPFVRQSIPVLQKIKITITKLMITDQNNIEIWVEFNIPKDDGVVIGTHIISVDLLGKFALKNSYGSVVASAKNSNF
jgi:hypothetical protein